MSLAAVLTEADALFHQRQYSRALPLYQRHINEVYQSTDPHTDMLAAAASYRMLAKCYRYIGQWESALPALIESLHCIQQWRDCSNLNYQSNDTDTAGSDDGCRALQLEQHVHHMLADTYSVLVEQQHRNISNTQRLSRALYHCLAANQIATELLDSGYKQQSMGDEYVAAVDASVAVQVSLGCVYRLMVRQAQQALDKRLVAVELSFTDATKNEPIDSEMTAEVVAQLRWQRHDILNLQWLSEAELKDVIAEWFREAKATLFGALRPLQVFRAHGLLAAICDELQKLYEASSGTDQNR